MAFGLALLAGCASTPVVGLLYTDTHSGISATSNTMGNRVGEACASSILNLVASGDASIEMARRNGAISMITSVDQSMKSYLLGAYSKYCTVVHGR